MKFIVRNSLPQEKWRAFVENHPNGNIFHTPEMFQVYDQAEGFIPELWVATQDDEVLALMVPVQISLIEGILRKLTTRSVIFGSVLCKPGNDGNQALKLLIQEYKQNSKNRSLFTELRNIYPLNELLPIVVREGFSYDEHMNYLINLDRPLDDVFGSIGRRTRKNIKNGLNKSIVSIEEVNNRIDLFACYKLLEMTYQLAQVPLAGYSLFEAAFNILSPRRMIRFAVAKVKDQAVATSIELLYKKVMYGWYGGVDRAFTSYVPNELLMWDILKWGVEHGYKQYDFGGAGKPNERYGVRDFKAKFGGDLVGYGRNIYIHRPGLYWLSKFFYNVLRPMVYGKFSRRKNN